LAWAHTGSDAANAITATSAERNAFFHWPRREEFKKVAGLVIFRPLPAFAPNLPAASVRRPSLRRKSDRRLRCF
jgi:hypothetical protein